MRRAACSLYLIICMINKAYTQNNLNSIESVLSSPTYYKIDRSEAQKYFNNYKATVHENICNHSKDSIIYYVRLKKGHIQGHIKIDENTLPKWFLRSFRGIRVYIGMDAGKNLVNILTFTKVRNRKHKDKPKRFYLLNANIDWCLLALEYKKMNAVEIKSNHRLCDPHCPDEKGAILMEN